MNHIYKIIWNKARACWQVVAETAKSSGKTKSSRRQNRRDNSLTLPALREYTKLAAALAVVLGCSLGGVVYAAEGETTGDGAVFYGTKVTLSSGASNSVFKDYSAGAIKSSTANSYKGVVLATTAAASNVFTVSNGTATVNSGTPYSGWASALGYSAVQVKLPDGTTQNIASYSNFTALATAMNNVYWRNPAYAGEISEAFKTGDLSKLVHMPRLYGDDGAGNEVLLSMGKLAFSSTVPTIIPSVASPPTYSSVSVAAGAVWQPMDRLLGSIAPAEGQYTIKNGLSMDGNGVFTAESIPTLGSGKDITVKNGTGLTKVDGTTVIKVPSLETGRDAVIDLTYANTVGGASSLINRAGDTGLTYGDGTPIKLLTFARAIIADNASLSDGTLLRLGVYNIMGSLEHNETFRKDKINPSGQDQIFIVNAATPETSGQTKLYVEAGWVYGIDTSSQGMAVRDTDMGQAPVFLGILNGAENFDVEARTSLVEGILGVYEITPTIAKRENNFLDPDGGASKGTAWYWDSISYLDVDVSESGKAAVDNAVIGNNLWKNNYLNLFRRTGTLHRNFYDDKLKSSPEAQLTDTGVGRGQADQRENLWAEVWNGKFKSASAYGRGVDQSYNGMQVGYDKLLNNRVGNGKVYAGFYVSKTDSDSHTVGGGGEQDSLGFSAYASWVGDKGHYLDAALTTAKLNNEYHLTGNTGNGEIGRVDGSYNTWAYGLGLKYGYQNKLSKGWFWEPSAALFLGHVDETSYSLSNSLGLTQGGYDTATGKLGLSIGRELAGGKGDIYAGVAAYREFAGGSGITALFGDRVRPLEAAPGQDTWWEFNLGGNARISPSGVFNLNLTKTVDSSIGSEWKINGGANWTWGGFGGSRKAAVNAQTAEIALPEHAATAVVVGKPRAAEAALPVAAPAAEGYTITSAGQPIQTEAGVLAAEQASVAANDTPVTAEAEPSIASRSAGDSHPAAYTAPENIAQNSSTAEYMLEPVTVEASRPDWEKRLSPGQVSVIYPAEFEGEQKDLPDLLDRVPGLFVQRVSGDGHYTVARVRGSTGAQVNVYVDGVLMNLNGDAAVNLSSISVDNVERIEVYRGYVPARFSGSPLGGVINIVTKKPKEVGGTISQGIRSYGGYTGSYELTAPLGDGSLLATYQRDIWDGDYPFMMSHQGGDIARRSNGYQNDNGMLKWQNDKWMVKAAWKDLHEQLPRAVANISPHSSQAAYLQAYNKGYYDADLDISQKEFQLGRHDTAGNLDWGWKAYYLDSKKNYDAYGWRQYYKDIGKDEELFHLMPGYLWTKFHSQKWGTNLNTSMKMGSSHLVEFNFDYSDESMDANGSHWDAWDVWPGNKLNRKYIHNYKIKEYHFTLQDSITLNAAGDFKLTPVLRGDRVVMDTMADSDKKWQYSGAAALQKQLNEHWSVKTNWGTYNRHPNFYELFGDGGSIAPNEGAAKYFDLASQGTWESGHQFDFGVNWQGKLAKADTDTALTWFQRRSRNQFAYWQPMMPNAAGTYFPMDDARVHGIELTHGMQWDRLNLSLNGTWQQSEYSDDTINDVKHGKKSVISYTPEWVWNARLDYLLPGDKLNIFAEYHHTSKQYLGKYNDESIDSFMKPLSTVNLGAKYSFASGWKLSAGVNDVFNKGYESRLYQYNGTGYSEYALNYPLAGRTYYATMEYKF